MRHINKRVQNVLDQWFLTWVRSNPRGSLSQSQGFGRGQEFKDYFPQYHFLKFILFWFCSSNTVIMCATNAWFILCTNKIYTYVLKKSYFILHITKGSVNVLTLISLLQALGQLDTHYLCKHRNRHKD